MSNVRVKLAMNLHKLQPVCVQLAEFQTALKQLHSDTDPDVKVAMAQYPARAAEEGSKAAGMGPKAANMRKLDSEAKFFRQTAQQEAVAASQPKPMPRIKSADLNTTSDPKPMETRRSPSFTGKADRGRPELGGFQRSTPETYESATDGGTSRRAARKSDDEQAACRGVSGANLEDSGDMGGMSDPETSRDPSPGRKSRVSAPGDGPKRGGKDGDRGQPTFGLPVLGDLLALFGQRKP